MSHFVKVCGWIEFDFSQYDQLKSVLHQWAAQSDWHKRVGYGVNVPEKNVSWSYFVFVGTVVKESELDDVLNLLELLVAVDTNSHGELSLSYDRGETIRINIDNGELHSDQRNAL